MAKPKMEELRVLDGDPDDYDAEDLDRLRAYKMMPRWGQLLAWIAWELPWPIYFLLAVGPLWLFFEWVLWWKIAALFAAFVALLMKMARRQASPFRRFVLVTKQLVPGELADTAAAGAAPPPEAR